MTATTFYALGAARFREQGIDPRPLAPAPFASLIAAEIEKWTAVVRTADEMTATLLDILA